MPDWVKYVPWVGNWFNQQKRAATQKLDELLAKSNEMLDGAFAEARRRLDEILEQLGVRKQELAGADGPSMNRADEIQSNQLMRSQGEGNSNGGQRVPRIPWKPTMTLDEARVYTQNSYYKEKIFSHGTNESSARNISTNGVDPNRFDEYSTYGPGFYLGGNRDVAEQYARRKASETGEAGAILGVMVDARKPKIFASTAQFWKAQAEHMRNVGFTDDEDAVAAFVNYLGVA